MANPIIKIKRGATAPVATLNAGEFAVDQAAKNLYLGVEVGGVVTNEIVGGSGTFATKQFVTDAVNAGTGSLGTMSTQNADSVAITGGAVDGATIGATTASSGKFTTLTASSAPSASNDVVRKTDLDSAISVLGSVFHYVGDVSSATTPFDLTTLSDQATGAYYKVDVDGAYTDGATTFNAKVGDAFVKTSTGWQKLDNVDAVVSGTANEIAVTGDENAGYTVAIDPVFSGRVSTAETDITDLETKTQNIDLAGTTANTTKVVGTIQLGDISSVGASINDNGTITAVASGGDKFFEASYYDGITLGAQYMPGHTVKIKTNLVGVDHSTNGTPSIENFIIDGGVY